MDIETTKGAATPQKVTPVYVVKEGEVSIDAPVQVVWKHMINYRSWQNYSIVEHISGVAGQEDEVVLLKKEETGVASTPYYARTIKLEPGRRVIWKTFRDGTDYFGIVEFGVRHAGVNTVFSYRVLYEYVLRYDDDRELELYRKQQNANVDQLFCSIVPKLKELAERESRERPMSH